MTAQINPQQQRVLDAALGVLVAQPGSGVVLVPARELRYALRDLGRERADQIIGSCVPTLLEQHGDNYQPTLDGLLASSDQRPAIALGAMLALVAERYDTPEGRRQRSLTWSDVRRKGGLRATDFTVSWLTFRFACVSPGGVPSPGVDHNEASPRFDYSFWLLENELEAMAENATVEAWSTLQRARRSKLRTNVQAASPMPSKRPMEKRTILFLAANPSETDRLALDQEAHAIQGELERSGCRDCFNFETRWAVQPMDLLRELRKHKPMVVHFSGHGGQNGLFFQTATGRAQVVSTVALAEAFGAAGASVKLVVLSACYTEEQAEGLLAHVDCVVGIEGSGNDAIARSFAIGFYGGIGEGESVADAYKQGRAAIGLEGLGDGDRPQLKVRSGVDANRLVLVADPL